MSKKISSRCWELVTDLKHPETGEQLVDISTIDSILQEHSQVISYGWIVHDKDLYTADDEAKNSEHKNGTLKNAHIHLVMKFTRAQELEALAKWFGFEEKEYFFGKKNNGRGKRDAYIDCLAYLTHEDEEQQNQGKYLYPDDDVHFFCDDGSTFREYLDRETKAIAEKKEKYGTTDISPRDQLRWEVMYNGLTIKQLRKEHPLEYCKDMDALKKCRGDYLSNCPPPSIRINIYIDGDGGSGKSLISKAIARAIIDPNSKMEDDDIFCSVSGDSSVAYESYDGQPILIWDDFRSKEVLDGCASKRGNVLKIFDVCPAKTIQKKKYSSTNLIQKVNITNSVQPWKEFLDGLAGEYIDRYGDLVTSEETYKVQSYRRFPIIITVTDTGYELRTNDGFFGEGEKTNWTKRVDIDSNLKELIKACGTNKKLYKTLSAKAVAPIVEMYEKAVHIMEHNQDGTDEEIAERFANIGKPIKMPAAEEEKEEVPTEAKEIEAEANTPFIPSDYYDIDWDSDDEADWEDSDELPF